MYQSLQDKLQYLVGNSIVSAGDGILLLSNGTQLIFDKENYDCCSSIELTKLRSTDNIITSVFVEDDEDKTGGEGSYKAWIRVITEAGELNIAEADGDASNGYYLHGFALDVRIKE